VAVKQGLDVATDIEVGVCEINLGSFCVEGEIDQVKHDKIYPLVKDGMETGHIRLAIQWIYSKVKLMSDYYDKI